MSSPTNHARRIAIIGGGIAGLAAAHRLIELAGEAVEPILFEASDRLGGAIYTERRDGFLIERGPDNFVTQYPWGLDLCRRLDLAEQLLPTNPTHRRAFVVRKGRLHKIPEGFVLMAPSRVWPVVTTPILSLLGKMRLACEPFIPRRKDETDESFASFAMRRLGRETYERLVQPLISSIYTADATRLSVQATMPQFVQMERKYGSLTWGMRKRAAARRKNDASSSGARYGMFTAPKHGMSSLVDAIVARLPKESIRLHTRVTQIDRAGQGRWRVQHEASPSAPTDAASDEFDAVIVALHAPDAARVLHDVDITLADDLAYIQYASSAVVSLAYARNQIVHSLDGFGYVVPLTEGRQTLAGSFSSVKYPDRAPAHHELIRVFLGGACQGELVELHDAELKTIVHRELCELLGIHSDPMLAKITRWRAAMPQYDVGHLKLVEKIEARSRSIEGLALAGNAYRGVGVPQCIHSGEQAAEQVWAPLQVET